ncbi:MAG: hypothetical protein R3D28_07460 [Geminicoccaceae bacterium]|nr:ribbon-helix-helix protein, CopG family [Geminicoccaceae bacterium]HRY24266.1 hypothetical protein [Geminicoccaceae bacterium]
MSATTTIRISLSEKLAERLDEVARRTERHRDDVVAEAIQAFLDLDAWHAQAIAEAVIEADAGGPFAHHKDVEAYLDALARGERPKPPQTFFLPR